VISAGGAGVHIDQPVMETFLSMISIVTNGGIVTVTDHISHTSAFSAQIQTFSGNISNSGTITAKTGILIGTGVTFAPGSAIVNSGTISGSAAAIDATAATSPVTINQTGGLISGAIKLSANADVLNISGGTVKGGIIGAGTSDTVNFALGSGSYGGNPAFAITGINALNINSGTIVLDASANSATNVTINGGILQIGDAANTGAALTSTNVDVVGGTLSGHGTINGGVTVGNGATLMPGGSIGILTINGTLALSAGATYAVEVSPTQASKTQVNGSAKLGGATVEAIILPQFGFHPSSTFAILTATNVLGAGNIFNPAVSLTSAAAIGEKVVFNGSAALAYDANDAFLTVPTYSVTLAVPSNGSLNAQNVANALNNFLLGGGNLPSGFQNLGNLSGDAYALNQLAARARSCRPASWPVTCSSKFCSIPISRARRIWRRGCRFALCGRAADRAGCQCLLRARAGAEGHFRPAHVGLGCGLWRRRHDLRQFFYRRSEYE
jgi:hypothetical protein